MRKEALFIVVIFLISVTIVSSGEDKVDDVVEEKLLEQERVKVIVVLKEKQEIKGVSKKGVSVKQLNVKEKVLQSLNKEEFDKKRDFGSFNGFSGEISKEGLEKLKLDENVEKIEYDYPVKALLQDSVPLINASIVHTLQINDNNITGNGETICIIDTGINYRHPDLGGRTSLESFFDSYDNFSNIVEHNNITIITDEGIKLDSDDTIYGNLTSIWVNVTYPIIKVKPIWNANGTIYVNVSVNGGIDWYDASNNTEISFDYNNTNTNLTYFVEITNPSVTLFDLTIDYTLSLPSFGIDYKVIGGYDYVNDDNDPIDDNGHGTHVAGIAAANSSLIGVAPNAKLISIKVLDDGGAGYISSAISGIDWCVNNATDFDISVISMSLGTTQVFSDYCDSFSSSLTDSINVAIGKNMTVVAASGNSGSTVGISLPACIENVTSVGGINKDFTFYTTTNRNTFLDVLAPAVDLNSTYIDEEYSILSGTSMATPHVAGAVILLKQYLKENNITITENEIEDLLKDTGKKIYDSGSSLTFKLINAYNLFAPIVIITSPINDSIFGIQEVSFNFSTNNLVNTSLNCSITLDGILNETEILFNDGESNVTNISNIEDGVHNWSIECKNDINYIGANDDNIFIVDLTNPIVNADSYSNSTNNVVLHYNVTDYNISDCRLFINDELNETDNIIDVNIDQTFNKFLYNGDYNWSVNCTDRVGLTGISDTIFMNVACSESWSCTDWSPSTCPESQQQTRTCIDSNSCGTEFIKPTQSQSCTYIGNVTSDTDGSSPSPSGGATPTTTETESVLVFSGLANDVKTFGISKDVGIEGITLTLKNAVTNAKLSVKKLDSNPSSTSLDNVYKYIQIDKSGINDEDIKEAVIKFKVEKNWINTNAAGVNYIYMQRYNNGKWEKLETLTAGSDDNYQKYQANTVGFSYFAVNAEKAISLPSLGSSEESSIGKEIVTSSESNVSNKSGFSFKNLFSGSVVKDLKDKIGKIEIKNLFSKGSIYNILFVIIVFLMLIGVTYKYREVILTGVRKSKKNIKFKEKDLAVKRRFFIFKKRVKDIEKKEVKGILDKIKDLEEVKDNKLKNMKEGRAAKLKIKEEEQAAKIKIEEAERAANLRAKEEARIAKENAQKAKLERFEVKDKSDEKWEDFDMESDWDEGD